MKLIDLLPAKMRKEYSQNVIDAAIDKSANLQLKSNVILGASVSAAVAILGAIKGMNPITTFLLVFAALEVFLYFKLSLKASVRIKKIETVFPDFIQLVSSNLRSGMTIEKAFFSSARPDFEPLTQEIIKTSKHIATGMQIATAFDMMGKRINSEKIRKIINLIKSGLKSGGNIAVLLETTSVNLREKEFLEKRATSNILMYVIFIFSAVSFGAPVLFAFSSVLAEVIIGLTSRVATVDAGSTAMPFVLNSIDIDPMFIVYFSVAFIIGINIISSLVLGLIRKGNEKYGLKFLPAMLAASITLFFIIRTVISKFLLESISGF